MAIMDEQVAGQPAGTTPASPLPPATPFQSAPLAGSQGGQQDIPLPQGPNFQQQMDQLTQMQPQINNLAANMGGGTHPFDIPQAPQIQGPIPPPERFGTGIGGAILGSLYGAARGLTMTPKNEAIQAEIDKANQAAILKQNDQQFEAQKLQFENDVTSKKEATQISMKYLQDAGNSEQAARLAKYQLDRQQQEDQHRELMQQQAEAARAKIVGQQESERARESDQRNAIAQTNQERLRDKDVKSEQAQAFNQQQKMNEITRKQTFAQFGLDPSGKTSYAINGHLVGPDEALGQIMNKNVDRYANVMDVKDQKAFKDQIRQVNTIQMDTNRMAKVNTSVFDDPATRSALQFLSQQKSAGNIGGNVGGAGANAVIPDSIKNNVARYMTEHNLSKDQINNVNYMIDAMNNAHESGGQLMQAQQGGKIGRSGQMMIELINNMMPGLGTMNSTQFVDQMQRYQQNIDQLRHEYQMDTPGNQFSTETPVIDMTKRQGVGDN